MECQRLVYPTRGYTGRWRAPRDADEWQTMSDSTPQPLESDRQVPDDDARWQLAERMVTTLPAFGNWATRMRDFETPLGKIGYRQAEALYLLRMKLLGPIAVSPSSMAHTFGVRPSAMTRVLNRLEDHGYIARRQDPLDRRGQTLHITKEGEAISILVERMVIERMVAAIRDVPSGRLPALANHIELLHQIATKLHQDQVAGPLPDDE